METHERLVFARLKYGISAEDCAEMIGESAEKYCRAENGNLKGSENEVNRIISKVEALSNPMSPKFGDLKFGTHGFVYKFTARGWVRSTIKIRAKV